MTRHLLFLASAALLLVGNSGLDCRGYGWLDATTIQDLTWYLVVPLVVASRVVPTSFGRLGLGIGRPRGWLAALVLYVLFLPVLLWASNLDVFRNYYPMDPAARGGGVALLRHEVRMLLRLLAWEYLFRGFLLLVPSAEGPWLIWNLGQSLLCGIAHAGKPLLEHASSFPGAFLMGGLAHYSRSILPGVILHFSVALTLDVLIVYVST